MPSNEPYTPTMETIKECFIDGAAGEFIPEDFDRALREHDAEVIAAALANAEHIDMEDTSGDIFEVVPVSQVEEYAARIRRGED